MNDNSDSWSEFRWELAFKKGDELAHLYFQLFNKYGDYPEGRTVIESIVSQKYPDLIDYIESDFILGDENPSLLEEGEEPVEDDEEERIPVLKTNELCHLIKLSSLGWCSINAALLDHKNRKLGLGILYYLGRALGTATCTLEEDLSPMMKIAFLKRSLSYINASTGLIHRIEKNTPELSLVLDGFISQLSTIHDVMVGRLFELKTSK